MCSFGDGEYCSVWNEIDRRAHKTHRCSICGTVIRKGDLYVKHFSVYDEHTTTGKICMLCEHAREEFSDVHGASPQPDGFEEALWECIVEESVWRDSPRALKLEAKTKPWRDALAGIKRRYRASPPRKSPKEWAA